MPRHPVLRKKTVKNSTYWFTKTGGDTYFGRADEVSLEDARKAFADHLVTVRSEGPLGNRRSLTVGDLIDLYLEWVGKWRSPKTYEMRQRYCAGFANYKPGASKTRLGRLPALQVRGEDLDKWRDNPALKGLEPQTILHAETSVRACFNWGSKNPSPTPYLPSTFRPFSAVPRTVVPAKSLTEADLMTVAERQAILAAAVIEPNQFRRHGLEKTVATRGVAALRKYEGPAGNFGDLLTCYFETGARTSELLGCRVRNVQFGLKQVVLDQHKRSKTQRVPRARQITLNPVALTIFARYCEGKKPDDHVFLRRNGRPWTVRTAAKSFERVKDIAAATKLGAVRDEITIYAFRHLWISQAMLVNPIHKVARMAGTSIAMIERVYGHFSNKSLHDGQDKLDEYRRGQAASHLPV